MNKTTYFIFRIQLTLNVCLDIVNYCVKAQIFILTCFKKKCNKDSHKTLKHSVFSVLLFPKISLIRNSSILQPISEGKRL